MQEEQILRKLPVNKPLKIFLILVTYRDIHLPIENYPVSLDD